MRLRPLVLTSSVLLAGCAGHQAPSEPPVAPAPAGAPAHVHGGHGGGHHHGPDHFADPRAFVGEWNSPERDAWQKPEEIVAALELGAGDTVVDLGAGTGYLEPRLSAAVGPEGQVIALDVEPAMLAYLDAAAAQEGWTNVRTHAAAYDDPQLSPASVDAVVTLNTWHHIEDRPAYAARLRACLRPGGAFVVVDFLKEETEGFGPPLEMRLSAEEVMAELRAGGFEVELVEETAPRHYIVRGRRPADG